MGRTLVKLASKKIDRASVFPTRLCIEICEKVHVHYRNLRIVLSMHDWLNMANGFKDALDRWQKRGRPPCDRKAHIELCRKDIINESENDDLLINLNDNLYLKNEGKIFSEGAELKDEKYIHLKIRDLRLELSLKEFKELSDAVSEANEKLEDSGACHDLQKA